METVGLVDTREPPNVIQALINSGWEQCPLGAGDYQWRHQSQSFGIERKTVSDLIGSLIQRKPNGLSVLQDELVRLRDTVDVPILMIEGYPVSTYDGLLSDGRVITRMRYDSLINFLSSCQLSGIHIRYTREDATYYNVIGTKDYFCNPTHTSISTVNSKYKIDNRVIALCAIPGLHKKRAETLLAYFSSLLNIAMADETRLMDCPDIGKVLAHSIHQYFRNTNGNRLNR